MLNVWVQDDRFYDIIDVQTPLNLAIDGLQFTEGPIWDSVTQYLTFSDIATSTMYRWSETDGLSEVRKKTNKGNGNTYDKQGNILTCEHATSRIVRTDCNGYDYEVLASTYAGKQLNSPNDVVIRNDGKVYFSDPTFGRRPTRLGVGREQELAFQGVFMLEPQTLKLTLVASDFENPNGLCFSPDEKLMYVADSPRDTIYVFCVAGDGHLYEKKPFAYVRHEEGKPGSPDGLKIDSAGNVYCAGPGGLQIFDSTGCILGMVNIPIQTANFAFGGSDLCTIYITALSKIFTIRCKIPGLKTK